ncbi:HAD family phosphatase [Aestuariivirga sp.]|uniref:HAD family hydrolase n=1 Tax=Aestuariivirga sp. TaxID=2650926 RepID=UPI0025B9C6AE|nr:HAD family phosphatase [Aestuariivirga sp.]MCA3554870.1 HAD family phosphatase [Aestuariivirga sp.]
MKPEAVIFDMDDVLCRYDLGRRLRALARITGQTPRDIRAAIWDSGFEDAADSGDYPDPDDYLREFARRLGFPLTRGQWVDARREAMTPWPDMLALAKSVGQQVRIAIYSNNGPLTRAALAELFPACAAIFAEHYHSFEFGLRKPDPRSFTRLMERMGADPARCWFIDDKKSNVAGARLAGLKGHHFVSHDQLLPAVRGMGLAA